MRSIHVQAHLDSGNKGHLRALIIPALLVFTACSGVTQRNEVSFRRGKYNVEFFWRHRDAFRVGAALHFSHAKQHDVLLLTPLSKHATFDAEFDAESVQMAKSPPHTEPTQELFAPYTARAMWKVLRAIDWTHMLHEQTYDIMSDDDIPWPRKQEYLDRAVRYYLDKNEVAFSPAPLDITMRRAAVMMKPYTTMFRTHYPRSNNFFYAAHWWHPIIYEAMMVAGNGRAQDESVDSTSPVFFEQVLPRRPMRMLLAREIMPRYARLSPQSANAFDNLHMFHGIVYDVLAYEGWSIDEKRAELYRVIEALGHQPGDEQLARKFSTPRGEIDPHRYEDWMVSTEGEMNRIMMEMMDEMMPSMMPGGMSEQMHQQHMAVMKAKLAPGLGPDEHPGSIMDAMKAVMPDMKMSPASMAPGQVDPKMVEIMLAGWRAKYSQMPDIPPWPMAEPTTGGR